MRACATRADEPLYFSLSLSLLSSRDTEGEAADSRDEEVKGREGKGRKR